MQWDLLPPWGLRMPGALVAGYSSRPTTSPATRTTTRRATACWHFAVIDGMGHGIGSTLLAGLAVGAYRARPARRIAAQAVHAAIDDALASGYDDLSFATGVHRHAHRGHGKAGMDLRRPPAPLLLRGRSVVAELECAATGAVRARHRHPAVSSRDLEPDDACCCTPTG